MTVTRQSYKTGSGYTPGQGNRELPTVLALSGAQSFDDDLTNEMLQGSIETVQSVYIDNSLNGQSVSIQFKGGPRQKITCPANAQGYFPVVPFGAVKFTATSTGAVDVPVIWSNTERNANVWKV